MPWKLVPPRKGKTLYWYVRGKYLGIRLDHSTGTGEARAARTIINTWRKQAERGEFKIGKSEPEAGPPTFATAAKAYMTSGGDAQYLEPILKEWPRKPLPDIDQIAIDTLASRLYPNGSPATRNRQVYTPVSAVLKRAGIDKPIKRPKGWQGKKSTSWLEQDQAFALFAAADDIEPEFGLLCRFLVYTGMRRSEALGLRLGQVRLDRSFVYLGTTKNDEARGCHLPPYLVKAFKTQPPRRERKIAKRGHKGFFAGEGGRKVADAGVPFLERRPESKLFRYHAGGALYDMLEEAMKAAKLKFQKREGGFHLFCHTYGTWMTRFGGLDTEGLTRTGRWADPDSAARYKHSMASEEAQRSNLLPTPKRGQVVETKRRAS